MTATKLARRTVGVVVALLLGLTAAFAAPAGAAPPTDAPNIVSPAGGATVTSNPILLWQPLPDVTKYRVQVSASATFSSTIWSIDTFNISATPQTELPLGTLYWRVAGMDGSSVGPFGSAQFVRNQAEAPAQLAPANGAVLTYPTDPVILRWEPVVGAKTYRVEVDDAEDFIGAQVITTDVPNWALLNTQAIGQTFYWRVQAQGTVAGVNTAFSPAWAYTLSWGPEDAPLVPNLSQPTPGQTVTDVVFRWSAVAGAARYQIQVSPNGDWANNVTIDTTVKGTSYSPATTLNNASYFWRVRALSVRTPADAGPWSPDGRQFTRDWADEPVLVSPANNDLQVDELLLQWNPVPFAAAYEVQIGTDQNFSSTANYTTCTTNHTDLTPTWYESTPTVPSAELPGACAFGRTASQRLAFARQGVRYYWRVRGLDTSAANITPTVVGRFSAVRSFMYLPRDESAAHPDENGLPVPTAPQPGSTVEVPTLSWTPVRGAERYEVRVYRNGSGYTTAKTYGTSFTPSFSTLTGTSEITWTVQALQHEAPNSGTGGRGPMVNGPAFTLQHEETTNASATPVLISPADGDAVVHPDFDWTPVTGAHHYEVRLFPAGSNVYETLVDHNEGAGSLRNPWRSGFTATLGTNPGDYEWQVVALTSGNAVISESERRDIEIATLDSAVPSAPAHCGEGVECTAERSTPLMQWEPVDGAAFYRVYVALDPNFTNIRRIWRTTQNSLRPMEALPDNQAGQSYYWFARPCRSDGICGAFDSSVFPGARAFRKQSRPITLSSPANGASVGNLVTFSWRAPSQDWVSSDGNDDVEARIYRIQVSTRPDFAGTLLDTAEVDQTTYTPHGKTYPEGPIYWRVQARDASGNYLTFSEERLVNKVSPGLVVTSPSNGADVNGVPVIQWNSQVYAASYEVEYYRNGDLAWTPANKVQTTLTQLNADTMVKALPIGEYAYRVRRRDVDNLPGPWTNGRTFDVVGGSPSPTAPANGTVFSLPRVRLEWDPVPGAVQYRVETSAAAGFSSVIEDKTTVMTAWSTASGSYPNGTVYWRVRALDAQGNVLGNSSVRNYVLDQTRPTISSLKATAGVASALVEWTASAGGASGPITSFSVQAYRGNTPDGSPVVVPGAQREVRVTGLVNGTDYRFRVTARDANGEGLQSGFSNTVRPQTVAPFASIDRFIERQYRDFLNRPPSSQELSTWRTRLQGSSSAQSLISSLWNSSAHANIMPDIARLYSAYYLRIPDFSGLMYWANDRMRGNSPVTLPYVSNFFANSAEFRSRYGNLNNRQFVELIYENILGRPGEASGVNFWTGELNSGRRTRGWVMVGFSNSNEYKTRFGPEIDSALIHLEMLRRAPTTSERNAMAARFRAGDTFNKVVVDVLGSAEYAARGI